MRVVCLHTNQLDAHSGEMMITIGKIYSVLSEDDHGYRIINDFGQESIYWKGRFESLDNIREEKLKELGI